MNASSVRYNIVFGFAILFLVSACSYFTMPSSTKSVFYQNHRLHPTIDPLACWSLRAKLMIKTKEDSNSLLLNWTKHPKQYAITLMNPLGLLLATVVKHHHQIVVRTTDDKQYVAHNLEELFNQRFHIHLPPNVFYYWLRGKIAPMKVSQIKSKSHGTRAPTIATLAQRRSHFTQYGFQINYHSFIRVHGIDLPTKMTILLPRQLMIKIVIYQWSFC